MNLTVQVKRVRNAALALSFVCAFAVGPVLAESSATAEQPSDTTAAATQPRVLIKPGAHSVGVQMIEGQGSTQVLIGAGMQAGDYKISRLSAPDRLVVDLPKRQVEANKTISTDATALISRVRTGAHPDAGRIVLDLASTTGAKLGVSDQIQDGRLVITVGSTTQTAATTTGASTVAAKGVEGMTRVTALSVENAGTGKNVLVADLDAASPYTLKRTAPSEYVLTIKNVDLDAQAASTLIAPQGSGAIRTVRPAVSGSDVVLRIFSAPEATLRANSDGSKIVVAASEANLSNEPRGQFAPEAASETAAAKASVSPSPAPAKEAAKDAAKDAGADQAAAKTDVSSDVAAILNDEPKYTGRLISLDLQDTDIDNALRIIAEVSNLNIIASEDVTGKVTLRLIDVPWDQALDVILKTNGLDKVQEGNVIRIAPVEKLRQERESLKQAMQAEDELEPLTVKYLRVSYSKAADLKPLVESVLTERGTVAYDDRTNQLIVKDIHKGVRNVAELVAKVDLRTPQVLLETQIVEAQRTLLRDLGSQLGFTYVRSPATGNPTGSNFPNAVTIGGQKGNNLASSFPSSGAGAGIGSAVGFLFDSADGTKSLDVILSALETEGRARVVSRPSVATTNNKQATIKSVEKIRVKTPSGGLSIATGSGASASGSSAVATEVIEIGIVLDVTPQASPDYYVLLDINAKSSTLGQVQVDGIPSEIERSATSTVLVSSGQTFAMGGIYKITDKDDVAGVPFLKDVPFLGHLFREVRVDNRDEELLFFITPRIIEGSFDDASMKIAS